MTALKLKVHANRATFGVARGVVDTCLCLAVDLVLIDLPKIII